jgi:hypothetical protein
MMIISTRFIAALCLCMMQAVIAMPQSQASRSDLNVDASSIEPSRVSARDFL